MKSNKFWGGGSSSSEDSSDSSSEDEQPAAAAAAAPRRPMTRWAEASSSEDEVVQKRVVRSTVDKRFALLTEKIKVARNHMKIDDFGALILDYEAILKMLEKARPVVDQEGGPPANFVKVIVSLEEYVEEVHAKHQAAKQNKGEKLTESRARAFNTLRAKIRKGNRNFQTQIDAFREHPSEFEEVAEVESDPSDSESAPASKASSASSDSADNSDSDSSGSGSDSDDSSDSSSSSASSSSDDDSYKQHSLSSGDEDVDEDMARERKMLRWLITPEALAKRKAAEDEQIVKPGHGKLERLDKPRRVRQSTVDHDSKKREPEEYTEEQLTKKVTEIALSRGRRGFERKAYMESLQALMPHAEKQGHRMQMYILSSMVSADFDNTGSLMGSMRLDLWNEALNKLNLMMPLLAASYASLKEDGLTDKEIENLPENEEDPTSHTRQQGLFVAVVERLDDELYKALQFTVDVYGSEYQDILANTSKFLVLLKRMLHYFEDNNQATALSGIALRFMEQIYYKPDVLNAAIYEAIHHNMPEEEKHLWVWPNNSSELMTKLCRYVHAGGEKGEARHQRALLVQAYHLALHDRFQAARDLLHMTRLEDKAREGDIHLQILFNRVLAQMGLCAFRLGKISDAHSCLVDVCMHGKSRELLSQGLSFSRNQDRTPEQERAERLRMLPYHMHINLEVLDTAHHISAMLLEVPILAMQNIDPTNRRHVVSRVLRRSLEIFDKQQFNGPPENAKESVVFAAKVLQRGNWQIAWDALEDLKVWNLIDTGSEENGQIVKIMIKEKVKAEGLRAYLFSYASIYDAFDLSQLVDMFDVPSKTAHSIISKMMIREEITAFWDESSKYLLMQHVEPSPLQRLALSLADRSVAAVDMNERLVENKLGTQGLRGDHIRDGKGRWDADGKGHRRFGGKGFGPSFDDRKGKGKGRGKAARPAQNRGWENARAGAISGSSQRGWTSGPRRPAGRPGGNRHF